ncbi:N-acetylglutamate kinase [Tangfeifania diversioriginum]|uniref:Acetylglutamate kinase n=1 Tax=Tangfeifania diversioriginum TaxID=1168035 RepID=A0A1M6N7I7_9BACT|nr:acetylglutamate kinase [Tangfeifania diversioriginum]SHJ91663.1 N-acetylglutamate kinase [Tangfeifania diversioriginum]
MDRLTIIKVGGKVVEDTQQLNLLLDQFNRFSGNKILVHGGGNTATEVAGKLGIETELVDGRRITSKSMLDVVTMVYGGLVNKKIVAGLQARGCNAIGLTGADLNLISAIKRPAGEIDYGFVGDVNDVNSRELRLMLNENVVPVVAPLTHDGKGSLLNTNADTIAAELAIELSGHYSTFLFYCFDKPGVLLDPDDDSKIIYELQAEQFNDYKQKGVISTGMLPKLDNGFRAKRNGVKEVLITNTENLSSGRGTRLV